MSLRVYNRKRKFDQTPEPKGILDKKGRGDLRFVVQMHSASRLHFDFRLEFGGVFRSWAVPKGPSLNPLDQRLAVFVEDHPIEYGSFEGIIPKGNYGAGTVMLWDEGTYVERGSEDRKQSEAAMKKNFEKGHITFVLKGSKLNGEFALIKLKKDKGEKAWLLVKKRDEHSTYKRTEIPDNLSIKTRRSIEEIAKQSEAKGHIWLPKEEKRKATNKTKTPAKEELPKLVKTKAVKKTEPKTKSGSDFMPRKNKPMLATISRHRVEGDQWVFEKFYEGLRALAEVEGKRVHLYSKSGLPFEKKFPEIVTDLSALGTQAVFDGEIVTAKNKSAFYIYDLLYFNGQDLRHQPLRERKKILEQISLDGKHLGLAEETASDAKIVAKNLDSIYHAGTSSDWLVIDSAEIKSVKKIIKPVAPTKKLETQKTVQSKAPQKNKALVTSVDEPRLTHLDKIYWPEEGYTKGDVIQYYKDIASYILPYLKDRPESLNRHPNGIAAKGFYQKDMTGYLPRWFKTKRIFSESAEKSVDYALCQDERSLLYIANLGCIELNPWFSRIQKLDHPDFLVIDLDPDTNSFDHVIEIAHEVHEILESIGAQSYCKTSGATGIHIGIPTAAKYDFDTGRAFTEMVCKMIAKKFPATTSVERSPNRRRGKIYLDFMQNRRGQTLAAPFCIRPKPGAPVSMPIRWKDLQPGLRPEEFNIDNALRFIPKQNQYWEPVLGDPIDLKKCVTNLRKKL